MRKTGKCDICGRKDSPLVPCGDHYHFACENCKGLVNRHVNNCLPERITALTSAPDTEKNSQRRGSRAHQQGERESLTLNAPMIKDSQKAAAPEIFSLPSKLSDSGRSGMRSERNLMPQRIPIKAAREVAKGYSCRQVIMLAWDGELTHIVTYGESIEDCAQAAAGGNMLKQKWGWPECNDQPSRVKKLEKELAAEREARERAEGALREMTEKRDYLLRQLRNLRGGAISHYAFWSSIDDVLAALAALKSSQEEGKL